MNFLQNLERRLTPFAIHHLTLIIVIGQAVFYFLLHAQPALYKEMVLYGGGLHKLELWRLFTFFFIPLTTSNVLFLFFALWIFYFFGSVLEQQWGTFRYNLYLIIGWLLSVIVAFIFPSLVIANNYLYLSVFFAFATLVPNYTLNLFFVLPVKVSWLAIFSACLLAGEFFRGGLASRLLIVASITNYLIFFGPRLVANVKAAKRRRQFKQATTPKANHFHECHQCHITDESHPDTTFRVCSICGETFCQDHIKNHPHT